MEDEQISVGAADAAVPQSSLTGKMEGQTLTEDTEAKNYVEESYDGGDGDEDEIMVEIVGSDVFIDGVDSIKSTDLGMEETEGLNADNLLHNTEENGSCNTMSEAKDVATDGDRNELDESKTLRLSSMEDTGLINLRSELLVTKDSEVDGEEKLIKEETIVAPEVINHPSEGIVTKEVNEIKENAVNRAADGDQIAVPDVSPKLDAECPESVVGVYSLKEFSAEDVKEEKSVVSIGEKVVDAESDDVRDLKKSVDGVETDVINEYGGNADQLGQLCDGTSGKILEVNEDKSLKREEQVNSDEPPIATSTSEAENCPRDDIYSGEVMDLDTSNEKVEMVGSEVSLHPLDLKGTHKTDDNVNHPSEDGPSDVQTAESIVQANVVCNDPMVINSEDIGLHYIMKDDESSQINRDDLDVQVTQVSRVSVQDADTNNVESTDPRPDNASNISLSGGVHSEEPLAADVASHDNLNKNNGYHVLEDPTSEAEAMNFDYQIDEEPTLETDNVGLGIKSATQTPKPSFKIGECIRRVASQLTGSTSSPNENTNGGSLNEQSMKQSVPVSAESSVDDMLSQLTELGCKPNLERSRGFPDPTMAFFLAFRRSIYLNKRGRKRKAAGGAAEEFEFDDVNDSYWTDRIVQNYSEEQLMQNDKNDNNIRVLPIDLERYAKRGPKPHARKRYSTGSYSSETTEEAAAKRRKQETEPAELILNFAERNCVPSEINLNKIFRRFGPIMESETEVDIDSGRARVIFKRGSDAEVANSSAEKFSIFGAVLVNYQIGYNPVISVKVLPIVVPQSQENQALMA